MNEFIVTGASGFLGRTVCEELTQQNLKFMGFSRQPAEQKDKNFKLVKDYSELKNMEEKICIHCAQPNLLTEESNAITEDAVRATKDLCQGRFKNIVFISSGAVYKKSETARKENDEVDNHSGYTNMKLACEQIILEHGYTVVRPSNIYGKGMSSLTVISKILSQLDKSVVNLHNTTSTRDFIYITDAAKGIVDLGKQDARGIFNLSSGLGTSITILLELIFDIKCRPLPTLNVEVPNYSPSMLILDSTKLSKMANWQPKISLTDGLKSLVERLS